MLKIKVIINNGILYDVLKSEDCPVEVEVINMDSDDRNQKKMEAYYNELLADPQYLECDYASANFDEAEREDDGV